MFEKKYFCDCKDKTYKYVGFKMSVEICYKCGKFHCKTSVKNDDFLDFLEKHPEMIPHLIEMKYLIPA